MSLKKQDSGQYIYLHPRMGAGDRRDSGLWDRVLLGGDGEPAGVM